jgi:hypothetical protein
MGWRSFGGFMLLLLLNETVSAASSFLFKMWGYFATGGDGEATWQDMETGGSSEYSWQDLES